jgi:hypothetical protein
VKVVVLDANELQRDWLCTGLRFQLLRHRSFYPPIQVYVPAVVVEELVANHAREVEEARTLLDSAGRKLARLGVTRALSTSEDFGYRSYLLQRFDEVLDITVLEWPEVSHQELVARAVNRIPPFDNRGSGYRDSLVWADVLALARSGRDVALVSQDKIFASGDGLAESLAADVADLPGNVELVRDFGSWLLAQLPWSVTDLDDAVAHSRDAEFAEWFLQSDFQTELSPDAEDLGFPRAPYSVEIIEVDWDGSLETVGSKISPDGVVLVEYDIGEVVDFEAELAEGTPVEDNWEFLPPTFPGRVTVRGRVSMTMRVGVLFADNGWSVDQLSWRRVDGNGPGASTFGVDPNQMRLFSDEQTG